jgi:hypothetical protein
MNYHARLAASTAMRRFGPETALFPKPLPAALNKRRFDAYTDVSINNERR